MWNWTTLSKNLNFYHLKPRFEYLNTTFTQLLQTSWVFFTGFHLFSFFPKKYSVNDNTRLEGSKNAPKKLKSAPKGSNRLKMLPSIMNSSGNSHPCPQPGNFKFLWNFSSNFFTEFQLFMFPSKWLMSDRLSQVAKEVFTFSE